MVRSRRVAALAAMCTVPAMLAGAARPAWSKSCRSTETAEDVLRGFDLTGKIIIYTGADGSIAGEATVALARAKASLILACRSRAKCEAARERISAEVKADASIEVEQVDLSSRKSIAEFATRVLAQHSKIDVLVNSAATYGVFMTNDNLVGAMEVNLLGPALLTHLLLPALRGQGRVVNVAAAAYDAPYLTGSTTVDDLLGVCTSVDPTLNATGGYFGLSKFLMVHHALELARREPTVTAVALAPGVAIGLPNLPNWLKSAIVHFNYPDFLFKLLPGPVQHFIRACNTNLAGYDSCPETLAQGAGVISAISAWPEVRDYSGSYFDFATRPLPDDAPREYGRWAQADPTCVPREPDRMDEALRSAWYDEMLWLMLNGTDARRNRTDVLAIVARI